MFKKKMTNTDFFKKLEFFQENYNLERLEEKNRTSKIKNSIDRL